MYAIIERSGKKKKQYVDKI